MPSLTTLSVKSGGTLSVAGGTAVAYTPKNISGNRMDVHVTADTDYRLRRSASFVANSPKVSPTSPNGYTQAKNVATARKPKLLANGKYTTNSVQISLFFDPETTAEEKQELMDFAGQCAINSELLAFFKESAVA